MRPICAAMEMAGGDGWPPSAGPDAGRVQSRHKQAGREGVAAGRRARAVPGGLQGAAAERPGRESGRWRV